MAKQTKKQAGIAALEQRIRDIAEPDIAWGGSGVDVIMATADEWNSGICRVRHELMGATPSLAIRDMFDARIDLPLWDNPTTIATKLYEAGVRA